MNRIVKSVLIRFSVILGLCGELQISAKEVPFPDCTRFATVGDSITHSGHYGFYLQLFYLTRFPERNVEVVNLGVAGDTAARSAERLTWDILSAKPNAVSVMFGMNDVRRDLYAPGLNSENLDAQRRLSIENYGKSLRKLIEALKASGSSVFLVTPSIYDETSTQETHNLPGVNSVGLSECARNALLIAKEMDLPAIDIYHPMLDINRQQQIKNSAFSMIGKDRVHPGPAGHLVMAMLFLRAQNVSPFVSNISIDAREAKVVRAENCKTVDLHASPTHVSFGYHANALPFPIESSAKDALEWTPIINELNQEVLQISGLQTGAYQLLIDGIRIRDYTADELARGVNLALEENTPQYRQALDVMHALQERWWHQIVLLRDIVYAEYGMAEETVPGSLTAEQIKFKLEQCLKSATGTSSEEFYRKSIERYLSDKPHEEEIKVKVAQGLPEIRAQAQPRPHVVEVTQTMEQLGR